MTEKNYVACIIINNKNEILLQKKTLDYNFYPGHWSFWGGEIEVNETPEQAINRELLEELNLKFTNIKPIKDFEYKNEFGKGKFYIFTTVFNNPLSEIGLSEGCGFAFFSLDEIKELKMMPFTIDLIKEFLENK